MNFPTATQPLEHQKAAIQRAADRPFFALFMEQGTGKSHCIISEVTRLFLEKKINGLIVLAPNGVHDNWAKNELPKHCLLSPDQMQVATWHSNDGIRARNLFQWVANHDNPDMLTVLLINIEALRSRDFVLRELKEFMARRKYMAVVDEASVIKNPKALQTKGAWMVAENALVRRILTGTPVTQGPLDLWSQFRFLSPHALPYPSYTSFKHEFAIEREMVMGNRHFRTVVGYRNLERLKELIAPHSFRVTKAECLDLPPKVYATRYVELSPEQRTAYNTLVKQCLVLINQKMLTTTMVITQLLRLHQIALGYAVTDDGSIHPIPSNRIAALMDILDEATGPAIIFCRFHEDVRRVAESFNASPEHRDRYVEYHGNVGIHDRSLAIEKFQGGQADYFIATSAAARGLTLHAAQSVIYYSQDYSLETRLQSEDRAHRIGQTKTVVYTDIVARNTIDERIIAALQAKEDLATTMLDIEQFKAAITSP